MRRFLVCLLIASVLAASGGCSQPVDTGSPVPAQQQPIVALLALAGLAIGIVAFIHHEHAKESPGPSPSPGIVGPKLFVPITPAGSGADMNLADTSAAVIIGILQSTSPSEKYQQVTIPSGGSPQMASCVLPSTYTPTALAIDQTGAIWFDDENGNVKRFAPIATTGGSCSSTFSVGDSLGVTGTRSMDADATNVYVAVDNGTGKVSFVQISISSGTGPSNSTTASAVLDPRDGITATTFLTGVPMFTGFRTDGSSFVVQNNTATANSFVLDPVPNSNPAVSADASNNELFFGTIGSTTSGLYQIAKYTSGGLQTSALSIASNGVTADSRFAVPLSSLRADRSRNTYGLDLNGNLVEFAAF